MNSLFVKRRTAIDKKKKKEKESIEEELRIEDAIKNMKKIKKNLNEINHNPNSKQTGIWKVKTKFFPKKMTTLPTAKYNKNGQIITGKVELKQIYLEHFHHRLRERPIRPDLEQYKKEIENEFESILNSTTENKYQDWNSDDLKKVIKSLKKSQSPDALGMVNEMFKNCGENMFESIPILCNKIKNECSIPDFCQDMIIYFESFGTYALFHITMNLFSGCV